MSQSVRVGIVGGGIRGSVFAQVVAEHPRGVLAGIAEPNAAVASRLRDDLGVPVFTSIEALLAEGVDAVVIATPDFAHLAPGLVALGAGVHVLFEKPLATTLGEATRLREAALASPAKVMVGFENRWNPKFQVVRGLLRERQAPLIAQRALLQDTEFVPRRMLSWAAASTPGWFLFPHSLDMGMWLSGARPVEVFARGVKKILAPDGIDTYDRIAASFLMSDGSILDLDSGWALPESRPAVFQFRYDIEAQGDHFEIEIDRAGVTRYGPDAISYVGAPAMDNRGRLIGPNIDMMRDFIDLCAGDEFDYPGVEQGFAVTAAIDALHQSLTTNDNVRIPSPNLEVQS